MNSGNRDQHTGHTTDTVLMIEPVRFGYNEQTAQTNSFQHPPITDPLQVQRQALAEFSAMTDALRRAGVDILLFRDLPTSPAPDSIFPNNWFSTHRSGRLILYPMATPNRRHERRADIIEELRRTFHYPVTLDMTADEEEKVYLEGTGSLVLDRNHRIAYAALSLRTQQPALQEYADRTGYRVIAFHTLYPDGSAVYHTNVMMSVGERIAVVCFDVIASEAERTMLRESLLSTHHRIMPISMEQMNNFAGNMLNLRNKEGASVWVMSTAAWQSLDSAQQALLEADGMIVHSPLSTIESIGGGSARCMIAEVFPPASL